MHAELFMNGESEMEHAFPVLPEKYIDIDAHITGIMSGRFPSKCSFTQYIRGATTLR